MTTLDAFGELAVVEALHTVLRDTLHPSGILSEGVPVVTDSVLELGELLIGHESYLEVVSGWGAAGSLPTGKRYLGARLAAELERRGYEIRKIP